MEVPLLDLPGQYRELKPELDAVWFETMESAGFIGGPRVKEFEAAIAAYIGVEYAVSCGNGTDALEIIMRAFGIGPGDEVITTPFTFWATVECIKHVGATPVFVDIEPGTYNIDVTKLEDAITDRTKAILPVHIFGQCADMDPLREIATSHGLYVVEDACQAIGATYRGAKAGLMGAAAAFSFFPSKNLGGAGDGGMITTNDSDLAMACRQVAGHCTAGKKYFHNDFGRNSRLDALQAGILSVKLPYFDEWNAQRCQAAAVYDELLTGTELELPVARNYGEPVYHLYVVKGESIERAEELMTALKAANIGTSLYYPRAHHLQEAFTKNPFYRPPHLPVAEDVAGKTFALPCFPGITREQIKYVANTLLAL